MSSIVNKVKEVLHSDNKAEQPEGTHGTHNSRVANAADPRIDSDRDHRAKQPHNLIDTGEYSSGDHYTTGTGTHAGTHNTRATGTHSGPGPAPNTAGPHKSDMLNKADPRVDSDRDNSRNMGMNPSGTSGTGGAFFSGGNSSTTRGTGVPEGTSGPHNSRVANAADPRVDSDRDGSRNMGMRGTGTTGTSGLTATTGMTGTHHSTTTHGAGGAEGISGPHNSRLANAADPRVDSDRDGSRNMGMRGTATTGTSGLTGTHHSSTQGTGLPEGTSGPHSSRLANAADPRVDSDRDGGHINSRPVTGAHGTHTTTSGVPEGTYGTHNSRLANAADPRIDSDRDGGHMGSRSTGYGSTGQGAHSGPGPAPNTAGPHKSDLLNKVDPRVDSNLDGSKTLGQEKTFEQSGGSFAGRDPTDAAQVPPSVLQKHIGPPVVEHDDHQHDRKERHSISHQEQHRGL